MRMDWLARKSWVFLFYCSCVHMRAHGEAACPLLLRTHESSWGSSMQGALFWLQACVFEARSSSILFHAHCWGAPHLRILSQISQKEVSPTCHSPRGWSPPSHRWRTRWAAQSCSGRRASPQTAAALLPCTARMHRHSDYTFSALACTCCARH